MYATIRQMIEEKRLFECGKLKVNATGSPTALFSTWIVSKARLRHEYGLTRWLWDQGLIDAAIVRGPHVDPAKEPDGTLTGPPAIHLEWDTGTETWRQLRTHFKKLAHSRDYVLVIAPSERRMQGVQSCLRGLGIDGIVLFTHLATDRIWSLRGQSEPLEKLWRNSAITVHRPGA
jgi:hypothetical protein